MESLNHYFFHEFVFQHLIEVNNELLVYDQLLLLNEVEVHLEHFLINETLDKQLIKFLKHLNYCCVHRLSLMDIALNPKNFLKKTY